MALRARVLALYRQIIREGHRWGKAEEREYIVNEARTIFRQNQDIVDPALIETKLFEGQSRLELGLHYKIPYPRLYNIPTGATLNKTKIEYTPAYMHSLQP